MVLSKLLVPGRPINFDNNRARAEYCLKGLLKPRTTHQPFFLFFRTRLNQLEYFLS